MIRTKSEFLRRLSCLLGLLAFPLIGAPLQAKPTILRMATTTSVDHSGLLGYLLPYFEKEQNVEVHVIAVGTGKALRLGRQGDVDVLLVHAPAAEEEFVSAGFGVGREEIMTNYFVLLGPPADPAKVKSSGSAPAALKKIAHTRSVFISRGDDSGTDKKEKSLWRLARTMPGGKWYLEVGRGMGPTLLMANEKNAYTLSDMGTYLAMKAKLHLTVCFGGDPSLLNTYSVMAVNPERFPAARYQTARKLIRWITGKRAQTLIAGYKMNGEVLFRPSRLEKKLP